MYAVVETGGKQYKVAPGDALRVEKVDGSKGDAVVFDRVLMIGDDAGSTLGTPVVTGATVKASVIHQGRAKKVIVMKYKKRKRYRVKTGHRQPFTLVRIESINK